MIYVMSDIHGQKRRFDSVMRQIGLRAEDTLYVLGDVIDRNPDGIGILRQIMAMPNANMLLGNHELMMMNALYYPPPADEDCPGSYYERKQALWYRNGGQVTHDHLKRMKKTVRQEIFEYLDKLPLNVELAVNGRPYILTHAAPADLYEGHSGKYKCARDFAVWMRFEKFPVLEGRTVIFGHTPTHHFSPTIPWQYGMRPAGSGSTAAACSPKQAILAQASAADWRAFDWMICRSSIPRNRNTAILKKRKISAADARGSIHRCVLLIQTPIIPPDGGRSFRSSPVRLPDPCCPCTTVYGKCGGILLELPIAERGEIV